MVLLLRGFQFILFSLSMFLEVSGFPWDEEEGPREDDGRIWKELFLDIGVFINGSFRRVSTLEVWWTLVLLFFSEINLYGNIEATLECCCFFIR